MNVALVHDWLTGMRGGEKCLEVFCDLFPAADLFTLVHVPGSVSPTIERNPNQIIEPRFHCGAAVIQVEGQVQAI